MGAMFYDFLATRDGMLTGLFLLLAIIVGPFVYHLIRWGNTPRLQKSVAQVIGLAIGVGIGAAIANYIDGGDGFSGPFGAAAPGAIAIGAFAFMRAIAPQLSGAVGSCLQLFGFTRVPDPARFTAVRPPSRSDTAQSAPNPMRSLPSAAEPKAD